MDNEGLRAMRRMLYVEFGKGNPMVGFIHGWRTACSTHLLKDFRTHHHWNLLVREAMRHDIAVQNHATLLPKVIFF